MGKIDWGGAILWLGATSVIGGTGLVLVYLWYLCHATAEIWAMPLEIILVCGAAKMLRCAKDMVLFAIDYQGVE